jgi:hypothetical protein
MTTYEAVQLDGLSPSTWHVVATDDNGGERIVSRHHSRAKAEQKIEQMNLMAAAEKPAP